MAEGGGRAVAVMADGHELRAEVQAIISEVKTLREITEGRMYGERVSPDARRYESLLNRLDWLDGQLAGTETPDPAKSPAEARDGE